MGTHSELIRARGHYYQLYTRQFRQELEQTYDPFALSGDGRQTNHKIAENAVAPT
jgi:hypothetical protein